MKAQNNSPRSLAHLLAGFGVPASDLEVTGIEMDSRRVTPGDLFLACRGTGALHGLAYLEQAIENGAAAVAWEPAAGWAEPDTALPQVGVPQLAQRAGLIAARYFGEPGKKLFTVGLTGTDGKTSTTHLITQALDRLNTPCAYLGTLGYGRLEQLNKASHTTPDPVQLQRLLAQLREQGIAAAAMEVSSHALHQDRVSGLQYDVAILTNITRDHLDYHGTVEHYAAAKRRLFSHYLRGTAVLNRDDERGRQWAEELRAEGRAVAVYGLEGAAPGAGPYVIARQPRLHQAGLVFDVDSSWGAARLESRLLGGFNIYNLCAALTALLLRGVAMPDAISALSAASTVPGRIEGYRGPAARPLVVVDYAHTPEALTQVLTAMRAHTAGQLWCVFGCGGDRDRGKRPLMAAAAARHADRLVITDDNPRGEMPEAILNDILAGLPADARRNARVQHERADAIRYAVAQAQDGDVVVVAGKGHEDYQIYGTETRSFSDRTFVASLVGAGA